MMKKIFALVMVIVLLTTLCSCKKISDDISDNSSLSKPIYNSEVSNITSEILESNVSNTESNVNETASYDDMSNSTSNGNGGDNQSAVSNIKTNGSGEKENNSSVNSENNSITVEQYAYITADESREPSTDVGSIISNGYVYYTNPDSRFEDGLFRKKIIGGSEETVTDQSIECYKILDERVYYISGRVLYSCSPNGSNIKKLYEGISSFEVAGNWIFANVIVGGENDGFYAISIDGSIVKRLGFIGSIHGFNRGYCYVTIASSTHLRIDYRSKEPAQCEIKINTEYIYEGETHYSFGFHPYRIYIINDYVIQGVSKRWAVSLLNKSAATIINSDTALPQTFLKDYFLYIPEDFTEKNCPMVFVGYDGIEKTYTFDWSQIGATSCQLYHYQDNLGNSVLLQTSNTKDEYTLQLIDSNGQVIEIYNKSLKGS